VGAASAAGAWSLADSELVPVEFFLYGSSGILALGLGIVSESLPFIIDFEQVFLIGKLGSQS
jgi:hypothetical protein